MREIKFRAWNDKCKSMIPVDTLELFKGGAYDIVNSDGRRFRSDDPTILMQYTGLKDKEEREVYEGDVVRVWRTHDRKSDGKPKTIRKIITVEWVDDNGQNGFNVSKDQDLEIIRNIYENPELLGAENA